MKLMIVDSQVLDLKDQKNVLKGFSSWVQSRVHSLNHDSQTSTVIIPTRKMLSKFFESLQLWHVFLLLQTTIIGTTMSFLLHKSFIDKITLLKSCYKYCTFKHTNSKLHIQNYGRLMFWNTGSCFLITGHMFHLDNENRFGCCYHMHQGQWPYY